MQERVFRFGLTGLTLILSTTFSYWLFGGNIENYFNEEKYSKIVVIAIPIISLPILGFIISSIAIGFLRTFWKKKVDFLMPRKNYEQIYLKIIYKRFQHIGSGIVVRNDKFEVDHYETLLVNHQIVFRQNVNPEELKFTVRRMDFYWAHVNTLASIFGGIILGFLLSLSFYKEYAPQKVFWIIPFLVYVILGWGQALRALRQVNEFEKRIVMLGKSEQPQS